MDNSDASVATADLLKADEVALIFRVSEETVRRWGRLGRLDVVRTPGGRQLYPRESVDRLLRVDGAA